MNLSLVYSAALHFLVFLVMFAMMQGAPAKKVKAVYTIDFIGSASQPLRYGAQEEKPAPAPAPEPKAEEEIKAPPAHKLLRKYKNLKKKSLKNRLKRNIIPKSRFQKNLKKTIKQPLKKKSPNHSLKPKRKKRLPFPSQAFWAKSNPPI